MSKKVLVIGGGIIGLCSANYLQRQGHDVTVIDQSNMDGGASYVNAGYISPSHIIPLSAPGVMKKGLKWMFNKSSPLYIKPRMNADFMKWTLAFNKSCNPKHVLRAIPILKDLSLMSQQLYADIKQEEGFDFHYEKKGLLMLCQTDKMLEAELKTAQIAKNEGLEVKELGMAELMKLEPGVQMDVKGATLYQCDSHGTPTEFMTELTSSLLKRGVNILKNEKVVDFNIGSGRVTSVKTDLTTRSCDEIVMSAGSWSAILSKKLGINLLLQAGKGYSINSYRPNGVTIPAILTEAKVAITPMNGFTRFAGTMEIAGINQDINTIRVESIANAVHRYYPEIKVTSEEKEQASSGLRPVSPNGLPYIGKSSKCSNLTFATGHAMMGWTLGPITGKLVAELVSEKQTSYNVEMLNPDRRF